MSSRAFKASILSAEPRLFEPIFLTDIQIDEKNIGNVYNVLNKRNASILR
jgi:elongation factor 2